MSDSFSDPEVDDARESAGIGDRPPAPEIKQPGTGQRLTYTLFSRETRAGRFLRALGRWLLTIILLVGAGALIAYVFLYRPVEQRLQETQSALAAAEQRMVTAQKDRDAALDQRQRADARAEAAQAQLSVELARVRLLRGMNALKNAELAVTAKNATAAKNAVDTAENNLKQIYTRLDQLDPTYSSSIEARFTLVRNTLTRDEESAAREIEAMVSELARIENQLK